MHAAVKLDGNDDTEINGVNTSPASASHTIVIIGGGFCGTILAANLLRQPLARPTRIILIERSAAVGRGIAYASHPYSYLLNVPANRMSANSREPLEFLAFARQRRPSADAEDYLPRAWYGEYLQTLLQDAAQVAPEHVSLTQIRGEARRVTSLHPPHSYAVELSDGRIIVANDLVLALGNPPPAVLPGARELQGHPAYIENPWALSRSFNSRQQVLIVGTGLTMTDALLNLTDDEQNIPTVHAISRRGLLPLTQANQDQCLLSADIKQRLDTLLWSANSARRLLAATRQLTRDLKHSGNDWRGLISGIRDLAPRLWQRLPPLERRRFVRHLQCYWDVCRHRVPAHVSEHIDYVQQAGKLKVHAGRIQSLTAVGERIQVTWRPRGLAQCQQLLVDAVINATGPNYSITESREPLLQSLRDEGLVTADSIGFGLQSGPCGAVINRLGESSKHLFYLGPMLRAAHWESTAVAELGAHAEQLASVLATERI